jgi:uncharacterized protein YceK
MKLIGLSCALIVILSIASGCASKQTKAAKQAEKEAYFNDGKMDQQVESWEKPGTRY